MGEESAEVDDWISATDLRRRTQLLVLNIASLLLDALFMALWVATQWALSTQVIKRFPVEGVDLVVLRVFQVVFAVSTLWPVVLFIAEDCTRMLRAQLRQTKRGSPSARRDNRGR
jgi:hypothetical protein